MSVRCLALAVLLTTKGVLYVAAEPTFLGVRVDVQIVALPPAKALPLLPALRQEQTADAALESLHELIRNGEADVLGWPFALARSGTRAVSESFQETRYPTEFDPPMFPQNLSVPPPPEWKLHPWSFPLLLSGAITPTAFETRNTGSSLDATCVTEMTGERIALTLALHYLELLKFHNFRGAKDPNGIEGTIVQPEFIRCDYTGSLTLQNGKRVLLSSFVQRDPQPHVILFLVRATTMSGTNQQSTE